MITSQLGCTQNASNALSFNKRLKALEQAIASYATIVSSDTISGNTGKFTNLTVNDTASITKENVLNSSINDLDVKHIDNRDGFAALGSVTVKSLQIDGEDGILSSFNKLTANEAEIKDITNTNLNSKNITADNLTVKNEINKLNLSRLDINNKTALGFNAFMLELAKGFQTADFQSAARPSWKGKQVALAEDTTTIFTLKGVVDVKEDLPKNASNGDCYFVRNYNNSPAVASYINSNWEYVEYPGLDDYLSIPAFDTWKDENYIPFVTEVTNYFDTLITDKEDYLKNKDNYSILSLYNSIQEILTNLDTGDYGTWRKEVNTFINTTFEEYKKEVSEELNKKIEDPEEDGEYLRKVVTEDENKKGEWIKLSDSDTFVNKKYEDTSIITNDNNGINLESTLPITASTPDVSPTATKEIVNREYLINNLKLDNSNSNSNSELTVKYADIVENYTGVKNRAYMDDGSAGTSSTNWTRSVNTNSWCAITKNYRYYLLSSADSGDASYPINIYSLDKNGKLNYISRPEDTYTNKQNYGVYIASLANYSEKAWNGSNEDICYFINPAARDTANTNCSYINIYKDGKYYGKVKDKDNNEYGLITYTTPTNYYYIGGKSLNNPDVSRIFVTFTGGTTTATDVYLTGYIIGVDEDGNEGYDRIKKVILPNSITHGNDGVAAGKNYFWFQNLTTNIFSRVDKNGNISSYPLVDPIDNVAIDSSCCNAPNNYVVLDNGDVIFYISCYGSKTKHDYFVYCSDSSDTPITVYRSSVSWSSTNGGSSIWPNATNYPFVESGNYVYFFPSFGSGFAGESTISQGTTTAWQQQAQQYGRYDKTAKQWQYFSLPFTVNSSYACYGIAQHVITKDGYIWVFPNEQRSSGYASICLCISPNGDTTTVELGTSDSINWFYPSTIQPYVCYLNNNGTANWAYAIQPTTLCAVNSYGVGCLVSPDAKYILLFKGNGEFKIYDYSNGRGGPNFTIIANINGFSLVPAKDGFILTANSTANQTGTLTENISYKYLYIRVGDDINIPPEFVNCNYNAFSKNYLMYKLGYGTHYTYEDYRKRFQLMYDCWLDVCVGASTFGLRVFSEKPAADNNTIYLKDGNNVISEVTL